MGSRPGVVSILTDFGTADGYVAAMKGVMLGIHPSLTLVDLSHEVPPQDVFAGALLLAQVAPFFPAGTVHLAVVDPGVGSARRAVAIETEHAVFVGPDNGLLSLAAPAPLRAHLLERPAFRLPDVSATFHGRDVFAPAAAYLAAGAPVAAMGAAVELTELSRIAWPELRREGNALVAEVVHVDRFGNLVTSLRVTELPVGWSGSCTVEVGAARITGLVRTYAEVAPGELLAYIGSSGLLEVAVQGGSAAMRLAVRAGEPVRVRGGQS